MAPAMKAKKVAMKAMKGQKAMTKGGLMGSLADATEMKKSDIAKILNSLTEIGTEEVKKSGKFILPGLHDQDSPEASNQGWQEVDVRQGGDGEGPACQDCREGKPRCGSEVHDLRPWFFRPWRCSQRRLAAPWGIGARLVFGGSA